MRREEVGHASGVVTANGAPPHSSPLTRRSGEGSGRILIAGGGTGGHLMPALAVAQALAELPSAVEPVLVGAERGVEARLLPQRPFRFHLLPAEPVYRRQWWKNARWPVALLRLWRHLNRIFRTEQPSAVLGTGGYASAPVVWWAARHGIPVAIQEQNAFPGLANRWLAGRVDEIYLGLPEARAYLKPRASTVVLETGNPIKPPLVNPGDGPWQRFGLAPGQPVVLITGGSQGALGINQAVEGWLGFGLPPDVGLIWVTGPGTYEQFRRHHASPRVHVIPFLDPMSDGYAVSQLVVSRAGMITVAELCAWGLPSILVPLPTAAADHQTGNARAMAAAQAAVFVSQAELTPQRLAAEVGALLANDVARLRMAAAALARGRPEAAREIAERVAALSVRRQA